MATVIAAHDLSGVGRCSLTTALAVLPVMGHTCYPLPTAILSQQTGLSGFSFLDFTAYIPDYLNAWDKLDLNPDLIYTGFLGGGKQVALLCGFIEKHPESLVVVDPVMGDNAKIYDCYDESFVGHMRNLTKSAHILLPNATEFNLLAGRSSLSDFPRTHDEILSLSQEVGSDRLKYMIITSAPMTPDSTLSGMCNIIVDMKAETVTELPYTGSVVSFSGAGDLFASAVCGFAVSGVDIGEAVKKAARFVSEIVASMPADSDARYGLRYEPMLFKLTGH